MKYSIKLAEGFQLEEVFEWTGPVLLQIGSVLQVPGPDALHIFILFPGEEIGG